MFSRANIFTKKHKRIITTYIRYTKALIITLSIFQPINFAYSNSLNNVDYYNNKEIKSTDTNSFSEKEEYILGPGDIIDIEIVNISEFSGIYKIGPTGELYLPRLREIKGEGYTIEELRGRLIKKYSKYLKNPEIFIRPISYRPIRVYVGGEVSRPGFYTLSGISKNSKNISSNAFIPKSVPTINNSVTGTNVFPTVFDAIQASQGVTAYSDLSKINIIRRISKGKGGGKKYTELNFLSLLTNGNESQNIRLFDHDVIKVSKSKKVLRDQLISASKTNLSPDKIMVFVTGRVNSPGSINLPQGASLNQALNASGGPKVLRGKVEFIRFRRGDETQKRIFNYSPDKPISSSENPILMTGDLIRVQDNLLTATSTVLGELTSPFIGLYSIINFFDGVL